MTTLPLAGSGRPRLPWRAIRTLATYGALAGLVLFGVLFLLRDATKYLVWTPEAYHRFWPNRGLLAIHVLVASVALLIARLQFVTAIRRRWPRVHRANGRVYVTCP